MKQRQTTAATEKIVASTAAQAQALFPRAPLATIRVEAEAWVHKALREARLLHPRNRSRQVAHAQKRANDAIRMNLKKVCGTMH